MNSNKISLTLPIDLKWVSMAEDSFRNYARMVDFNKPLENMLASAIDEACGKLAGCAADNGIEGSYTMNINSSDIAITVEITYDKKIPLNPMKEKDFEVMSGGSDINFDNVDRLWLFLIKKYMDRVFFRIDGNNQTLRFIKYRREKGKESRIWIMDLKPQLKKSVEIEWIKEGDNIVGAMIQNYKTASVLKFGKTEAYILQHLDGKKLIYDIYIDAIIDDVQATPQILISMYNHLVANNMLVDETPAKPETFFKKLTNKLGDLTYSIPHADQTVTKLHTFFSPVFSVVGVTLLLLVGLSGIIPLLTEGRDMSNAVFNIGSVISGNFWIIIPVYLLNLLFTFLHEFAHGLTCKHFGGRVSRLGVTQYLVSFIFFCDTTSSYAFPKKSQKILVSLAGPIMTFFLLGIGLWMQFLTASPQWKLVWTLLNLMLIMGLVLNFNPLLRMDSYYILMDLSEIPNLKKTSSDYIKSSFLNLFRRKDKKTPIPPFSLRKKLFLLTYGFLAIVMTAVFIVLPIANFIISLLSGTSNNMLIWTGIALLIALLKYGNEAIKKLSMRHHREYELSK